MRLLIIIIFLVSFFQVEGQKEDHVWLFGWSIADNLRDSIRIDTTWGATNIDFNFEPPKIYYDSTRIWDMNSSNSSICDINGSLDLYTNGMAVYDGNNSIVEDTICYGVLWNEWTFEYEGQTLALGFPYIQSSLMLPKPNSEEKFIIYNDLQWDGLYVDKMKYSIAEKEDISDLYSLSLRDQILVQDSIASGGLNACRHGNGRDWWIIFPDYHAKRYYKFLLDPDGLQLVETQDLWQPFRHVVGQLVFSSDGSLIANCSSTDFGPEHGRVKLMSFDRCSGDLLPMFEDTIGIHGFTASVAFAHNNQFLYASNDSFIFQYDLSASNIKESRISVATFDSYRYYYPDDSLNGFPTSLSHMGLAPNGKIYISSGSGTNRKMSVMNHPNRYGELSEVLQHAIHLPTSYIRTIPNYPNYRLGPLDGSECDTLDLNNIPVAKFRYDQDDQDYLKIEFTDLSYFNPQAWEWDFGDGEESQDQFPMHTYESSGMYEVCLRVSNENDDDVMCRLLNIATNSAEEESIKVEYQVFPNPAREYFMLSLDNYIPKSGNISIFDQSGRVVQYDRIKYGWNNIRVSDLKTGLYYFQITDEGRSLATDKLVIIK